MRSSRDRLEKDFQALLKDTKDLLKATAQNVTGEAQDVRRRVEDRLNSLQSTVQVGTQAAEDTMREGLDTVDEVVREYPYHAIGVSFFVGIMFGLLFRRR